MPVLIHRRGKEGTPDICEKAVRWTMGVLTDTLWANKEKTELLAEFRSGDIRYFEYPETATKKYIFPKRE